MVVFALHTKVFPEKLVCMWKKEKGTKSDIECHEMFEISHESEPTGIKRNSVSII